MSKKLLNEGTVRRFMKLANIGALSSGFVNEMEYSRDDEPLEEEESVVAEEEVLGDEDEFAAAEEPAGEEELDVAPEEEVPEGDNEDLLRRVVQAVATELDVEVEIEGEEGEVGDEEELGAEPEVEEPLGAPELGGEEELPPEEEDNMLETVEALLAEAGIEVVDDEKLTEDLVKKVAGRVAKRLLKEFG
tara:strand:- start:809 stop:1378 length:570 start_codon:yes stop_codon:yes gene_type:complete